MEEKTREERIAEDIESLQSFVSKAVSDRPEMSKEDAIFEICALIIESSVGQSQLLDSTTKMIKFLTEKVHVLEMRLAVIEEIAMPLLKDLPCMGNC